MSDYKTITANVGARGVAIVALARPEKRNAMTGEMVEELADAAHRLEQAKDVRCVVLTGQGRHFCAGGDLSYMRAQIDADRELRLGLARRLASLLSAFNDLNKPLIGRINGGALGGGLGLVCVCDVAVAAESAEFGFTETRLGLVPATIGPFVIARMGEAKARRVFMSGRIFSASEAVELDLIARAVPDAELDAAIEAEIAPYLMVAPGAVASAKKLCRAFGARIDDAHIESAIACLADAWESEEARHGIDAFLAKQSPRWAKT